MMVGIMDDRNDIDTVAGALGCPPQQALRVLEELERRGLVTTTNRRNQWDKTREGNRLAFYCHPPRRFTPVIDRPSEAGIYGVVFTHVPCSIWHSTDDEEVVLEEAEIDVALHVDYEGDRLIEINVNQPDEYQGDRSGSAETAMSLYITAADAKRLAAGLQEAIAKAEAETARRQAKRSRNAKRAEAKMLRAKKPDEHG